MEKFAQVCWRRTLVAGTAWLTLMGALVAADKRAPPPDFESQQLSGVFFERLEQGLRGDRPELSSLRAAAPAGQPAVAAPATASADDAAGWAKLVSAGSLEDEVKRVRLRFDAEVTTPAAFNGGGYQNARRDLSILATLFAVISQYNGDVRWKEEAAAARDLLARTASNCKAGSTQVYNEVKLRKNDLQDLVSGSGLASREAEPLSDWSTIVDRSPLMEYLEGTLNSLQESSNSEASIAANSDAIRRQAELIAMVGQVLAQEGMEDADDDDYRAMSSAMTAAASSVSSAMAAGDLGSIRERVGAITQACDACHEQYR